MAEGQHASEPDGIPNDNTNLQSEQARIVAWDKELRSVHDRLRTALLATQDALADGASTETATRDLLLFCHGFCVALTGHHHGEDRTLFPAITAAHPDLRDTLRKLEQDHSMIGHLLGGLQQAVDRVASPDVLADHLEGIAAIMENHFRFEERALISVLARLGLDAAPRQALGPL